jgi:hypothetical protein
MPDRVGDYIVSVAESRISPRVIYRVFFREPLSLVSTTEELLDRKVAALV